MCLRQSGGGLYNEGGDVAMQHTLFRDNVAPTGANINPDGGLIFYTLPTPPGYWLPNSACVVNREPCGSNTDCQQTAAECSVTAGNPPDYQPRVNGYQCNPPILIQTCDWQSDPELLGGVLEGNLT